MAQLKYERYQAEFEAETGRLAAVIREADPSRPVPNCPEWTLTDLTSHLGHAYGWAATMVQTQATSPLPVPTRETAGPVPAGSAELAGWLVAAARHLAGTIRAAGPQAPVWNWSPDRTAGFWLRRMLHDTVVHRLDAEFAVGRAGPLTADLAADGISDLLSLQSDLSDATTGHPVFAGLRGDGETLHFHATDQGLGAAGEWLVCRGPDRVWWQAGRGKADVAVRGRALDLLLLLNRRAEPGVCPVEIFGDEKLLDDWLANSRF